MSSPKFCMLCNRNVIPAKSFNGLVFLILFLIFIVPACLYLLYYLVKPRKCPICHGQVFGPAKADLMVNK